MTFINKRAGIQTRNEKQSLAFSVERIVLRGQFCKILRPFGLAQDTVLTGRQKAFRLRKLEEIKLP